MKRIALYSALFIGAISVSTPNAGAQSKAQSKNDAGDVPVRVAEVITATEKKTTTVPTPETKETAAAAKLPTLQKQTLPAPATQTAPSAASVADANAGTSLPKATVPPVRTMTAKERAQAQLDLDMINAAFRGETWQVRDYLAKGARVNAVDHQYGFSPLMWASKKGHLGTVRFLLSKGAKPNLTNKTGMRLLLDESTEYLKPTYTEVEGGTMWLQWMKYHYWISESGGVSALVLAATGGYNLTVRELLQNGADPNLATADGETPLMSAAYSGNLPAIQALIERGAKVNARERSGQTALLCAAAGGHESAVRELLAKGADPTLVWTRYNVTPAGAAKLRGYPNVATILTRAEKSFATKSKSKTTSKPKPAAKAALKKTAASQGERILN